MQSKALPHFIKILPALLPTFKTIIVSLNYNNHPKMRNICNNSTINMHTKAYADKILIKFLKSHLVFLPIKSTNRSPIFLEVGAYAFT